MSVALQLDPSYLEQLYEQYKNDPDTLDPSWQHFFFVSTLLTPNLFHGLHPEITYW